MSAQKYMDPVPGRPSITEIFENLLASPDCHDDAVRVSAGDFFRYVPVGNNEDVECALWSVWSALFGEALTRVVLSIEKLWVTEDRVRTSNDVSFPQPGMSDGFDFVRAEEGNRHLPASSYYYNSGAGQTDMDVTMTTAESDNYIHTASSSPQSNKCIGPSSPKSDQSYNTTSMQIGIPDSMQAENSPRDTTGSGSDGGNELEYGLSAGYGLIPIPRDAAHRRAFFMCPGLDRLMLLMQLFKMTYLRDADQWGTTVSLWSDLPFFDSVLREEWNTIHAPGESTKILRLVVVRFITLLTSASIIALSHLAIWSLRDGLEGGSLESAGAEPRNKLEEDKETEMAISEAALWLAECAAVIWRRCAWTGLISLTQGRMTEPGRLFVGQPWYSLHRWAFWKKRVDELLSRDAVRGDAKIRLQMAAKAMHEVEQLSTSSF